MNSRKLKTISGENCIALPPAGRLPIGEMAHSPVSVGVARAVWPGLVGSIKPNRCRTNIQHCVAFSGKAGKRDSEDTMALGVERREGQRGLLGKSAPISAGTVARLKTGWQAEWEERTFTHLLTTPLI